jgi:hypothetical protein
MNSPFPKYVNFEACLVEKKKTDDDYHLTIHNVALMYVFLNELFVLLTDEGV